MNHINLSFMFPSPAHGEDYLRVSSGKQIFYPEAPSGEKGEDPADVPAQAQAELVSDTPQVEER